MLFIYNSNFCIDRCILFKLSSSGHSGKRKRNRAFAWWSALLSRGRGLGGGSGRDRGSLLHRGWWGKLVALSSGPHPQTHSDWYLTALSSKTWGIKKSLPGPRNDLDFHLPWGGNFPPSSLFDQPSAPKASWMLAPTLQWLLFIPFRHKEIYSFWLSQYWGVID